MTENNYDTKRLTLSLRCIETADGPRLGLDVSFSLDESSSIAENKPKAGNHELCDDGCTPMARVQASEIAYYPFSIHPGTVATDVLHVDFGANTLTSRGIVRGSAKLEDECDASDCQLEVQAAWNTTFTFWR